MAAIFKKNIAVIKQFYFIGIELVAHKCITLSTKASLLYALGGFIGKQIEIWPTLAAVLISNIAAINTNKVVL